MISWFRGVIQDAKDTADGVLIARAIGRGVRDLKNVKLYQQRGFTSVPLDKDVALFLQADDLVVATATATKDKPLAAPGETILYASDTVFVKLNPDGSVRAQGSSDAYFEISADGSMKAKAASLVVEADEYVNVLSPKIGLGKDALLGTPLELPVTTGCSCIFGVLHPMGVPGVTIPLVPSP